MEDFTGGIKQMSKSLQEIQKQMAESMRHMSELINQINKSYFQAVGGLKESLRKFAEALKNYYEQVPKYLLIIAEHGWFIELDSDLILPAEVVADIKNNKIKKVDNYLCNYHSENFNRIKRQLLKRHSKRKNIFNEIFIAHMDENYCVAIPTILSQVDGICYDFTKKKFFIKDKKLFLPEVTADIENLAEGFLKIFLSPIQNQTPIMARKEDLVKYPSKFNRHEIIHGVSTTYGNKINSYKALSLLKYISDLLMETEERKNSV